MTISIASYAFHGLLGAGQMDVFGYLESCKYRYGLQTADIWNGMLATTDEDYIRKVKQGLDERELALVNLCVDGAHIWEEDPLERERTHQNALAHLRVAETLGARTVRIDAGGKGNAFSSEAFDWVVKRYREYTQRAYDHGYKLGPENHWGPERVPASMLAIREAVASPAFGLLLHLGNWETVDRDQGDQATASFAMHTHISWEITEGPLPAKMKLLADAGYTGCWGVEHHTGQHEYAEVAIQLGRVRSVLERWRSGE